MVAATRIVFEPSKYSPHTSFCSRQVQEDCCAETMQYAEGNWATTLLCRIAHPLMAHCHYIGTLAYFDIRRVYNRVCHKEGCQSCLVFFPNWDAAQILIGWIQARRCVSNPAAHNDPVFNSTWSTYVMIQCRKKLVQYSTRKSWVAKDITVMICYFFTSFSTTLTLSWKPLYGLEAKIPRKKSLVSSSAK